MIREKTVVTVPILPSINQSKNIVTVDNDIFRKIATIPDDDYENTTICPATQQQNEKIRLLLKSFNGMNSTSDGVSEELTTTPRETLDISAQQFERNLQEIMGLIGTLF
jgi:hypothetical protein